MQSMQLIRGLYYSILEVFLIADSLNSLEGKNNMINRIYESFLDVEFKTLKMKTVRTSVNALISIIKGGRTLDALIMLWKVKANK